MNNRMCGGTESKRRVQNMAAGFGILTNASVRIFFVMRGLDRASIHFQKNLAKRMDCRVKPGNDASV
jgi:hypothetical protein